MMIPAIQSFFEILNYYAGLGFQIVSFIHDAFTYITTGLSFVYGLLTLLPVWVAPFAILYIAYCVYTFVIHPE